MPNVSKKIQIISMDSRHQKNIIKLFTNFLKNKIHTKLLQPEGVVLAHTRSQQNETAPASHTERKRREQRLCSSLGQPAWAPRALPLSFAHVHAALLGGGHEACLGEQAAYAFPREKPWGTAGATTRPKLSGWFSIDG
jgi:hypothetical protein